MANKPIAIVTFKNGEYFRKFTSITEFSIYLKEERISPCPYDGIRSMLRGWIPPKNTNLYGWSAMREDKYKRMQEGAE